VKNIRWTDRSKNEDDVKSSSAIHLLLFRWLFVAISQIPTYENIISPKSNGTKSNTFDIDYHTTDSTQRREQVLIDSLTSIIPTINQRGMVSVFRNPWQLLLNKQ
jgi:hypothetical protein